VFSFSTVGWSRTVTNGGFTTLRGQKVAKIEDSSNMWVTGAGFEKTTLYVTDTAHPLPLAISGPPGTSGVIYFSKWGTTVIAIPSATIRFQSEC
jgi:hypothetical protein